QQDQPVDAALGCGVELVTRLRSVFDPAFRSVMEFKEHLDELFAAYGARSLLSLADEEMIRMLRYSQIGARFTGALLAHNGAWNDLYEAACPDAFLDEDDDEGSGGEAVMVNVDGEQVREIIRSFASAHMALAEALREVHEHVSADGFGSRVRNEFVTGEM